MSSITRPLHENADAAHVRGGYSRGYAVALLAPSLGIENKQEPYTGITRGVVRGRRRLRWDRGGTQGPKFVAERLASDVGVIPQDGTR